MTNQVDDYGYVLYIDEAGDPGLTNVRPIDENGSSEWLMLSGILVDARREAEVVGWVDSIRIDLGIKSRALHYKDMSPTRKRVMAERVAALPLRAFVVCSNKKNMRRHHNARAALIPSQQYFYNWMVRLLLERVTAYCDGKTMAHHGERKKIKIEFSQRGGHNYPQTHAYYQYLTIQQQSHNIFLKKRQPVMDLLDRNLTFNYPHYMRAGMQLADCIASAFYQAADCLGPGQWDLMPAMALKPRITCENGSPMDFGVCLQPTPAWKGSLTSEQQQIFKFYGYDFEKKWQAPAPF